VHSIQIGKWRKELVERAHELFVDGRRRGESSSNGEEVNELLQTIGRLKVENDFLKKNLALSSGDKLRAVEREHNVLSIARLELLGLTRSLYY
jgi:hypothetical protein